MNMYQALHQSDGTDWLYTSRKVGRVLANIDDYVDDSRQRLDVYIKKNKERLIS